MAIVERLRQRVVRRTGRGDWCIHLAHASDAPATSTGCGPCLATGQRWVHLRRCLTCGHVGCCNESPGRHAEAHWHELGHPVIRSHEHDERWSYCFEDGIERWPQSPA
jgi:hypothetical protein